MNWQSTKLLVTLIVIILSFAGVMTGDIEGAQWGTITVFALGIYAHHDVAQKKVPNGNP